MQVTTEYRNTISSLVEGQQNRLSNPYYKFIDKKPTIVDYWNMNTKRTTLDEGSKTNYDQLGTKSPLRYNKVNSFVLYGLPQFPVNMQLSEYGVESNPIEAEALILPNTIIPCVDDYFTIQYLTKPYIFRVNNVTIDTLENGSNFYIIQIHLDNSKDASELHLNSTNLVDEYDFKIENIGTNKSPILLSSSNKFINTLASIYNTLRSYYVDLFYRRNIDTFVYGYLDMYIYDPYLIEFLIRNSLFSIEDNQYMYISQATHKPSTFSIEYEKTIFRDVEKRNALLHLNSCYPIPVHDPNSLLLYRMEDYMELSINLHFLHNADPINWLDNELFDRITDNNPYDENDEVNPYIYRNLIINYLNSNENNYTINDLEVNSLMNMTIKYCKTLFYEIPIIMYILNAYINGLESDSNDTYTDNNNIYMEKCFSVGQ